MTLKKNKSFKLISGPIWGENPISIQMLGICSALAVTVQLETALVMALSLMFVLSFSNMIISLLRHLIPKNIRIIVEMTIIAALVILTDEFLKAFFFDISRRLSVFVGLIITNCIVLGRAEACALSSPWHRALLDGLGNGLGYGSVLMTVAFIREFFGSGKLFGMKLIPRSFYAAGYEDMGFMLSAPAAFIIIGLLVWLQNVLSKKRINP